MMKGCDEGQSFSDEFEFSVQKTRPHLRSKVIS